MATAAAADMVDLILAVVRDEMRRLRIAEVGLITQVYPHESGGDKNNYECGVRLRDSGLELQRVPVATARIGFAAIPNVNDLVLVQFVGGDLHCPVITGSLYNDSDRPPEAKARESVYVCPDAAESGVRRFYLELPNGNKVLLDDDKLSIEMAGTKITVSNDGDVEILSNAKITLDAQGNVALKSQGDISLEAGGALKLKATGDLSLDGMSVAAKAQTTAQWEGQANTTVKGPLIKLAGMTDFSAS